MWGPFCDIPDIVANLEVDEDEFRIRHNKEANEREEQPSSQERRHADTFESIAGTTEGGVRQPRSCPRGRIRKPEWMNNCKGRARADFCDYYDNNGKSRCGKCYIGKGMHAYECAAAHERIEECEYFDERGYLQNKEIRIQVTV